MQRTFHFNHALRTALSPGLVQRVSHIGQKRHFAEGAWIQQQGDEGKGLWLILSGRVAICRHGVEGEQTIFAVLGAGDLLGELAYFAGVERQVDAIAQEQSVLVWIGDAASRRLLSSEPDFATSLLASLANQLRTALDRIDIARHGKAETRLAAALLDMAGESVEGLSGERDGRVVCTQQELSDFIGVSRVRTGALLARFEQQGMIVRGYGWIGISDAEALHRLLPV